MELLIPDTPIVVDQYCDFTGLPVVQIFASPGVPQSLTGYTFLCQARAKRNDSAASPLAAFTVTVNDVANGILAVTMPNTTVATLFTAALAANNPVVNPNAMLVTYYDLIGISPGGIKTKWLRGPCLLAFGVSH